MSVQFFPLEGCLVSAADMQTALALSELHLFQSTLNPDAATPLADYTTAEADYTGYALETLTAWFDPQYAPGTGYMIASPQVQFLSTGSGVTNVIGGCYLVDANGDLRLTVTFTDTIPMQIAGQGILISLVWLFPTGL